ncbi:MAG TPA: hypothetical protein VFT26_13380 [Pyrinomonadaceae bacterium]|nr:hypothetical protein [Pyrinomonadaceae bacterium]
MTTKKILLMIGGVVVVLGFLVICFVGAIVGFALYSVGNSEAASRARDFLRNNEKLRSDIGTVKDFGSIVTGNVSFQDGTGTSTLHLKVIGERQTVNATVELILRNREWSVIGANYVNSSGQTIQLLDPYDSKLIIPLLVA